MPVTSVDKDLDQLTLTIVAEFTVPVRRLRDAYVDPRQLEKFWGPPTWPATFTRHDVFPGGRTDYYMTGPDGSRARGYWEFLAVDEGRSFEVLDGFTRDDGAPDTDLPTTRMVFSFEATEAGSRLTTTSHFGSLSELEQLIAMGMEEGTREAMGQIDAVVADDTTFAADAGSGRSTSTTGRSGSPASCAGPRGRSGTPTTTPRSWTGGSTGRTAGRSSGAGSRRNPARPRASSGRPRRASRASRSP